MRKETATEVKAEVKAVTPTIKWIVTADSNGIKVDSKEKDIKIDDVVNGVLRRSIHNYRQQVSSNMPEGTEEDKVKEDVRRTLYFKNKMFLLGAMFDIIGKYDEVKFNDEVYGIEREAFKAVAKGINEEKTSTLKKSTASKNKKVKNA